MNYKKNTGYSLKSYSNKRKMRKEMSDMLKKYKKKKK
tara:strand:+ start:544 stop:654 length:111 start_codon:yes stop_codon:yes gene_type:complete